MDFTLPMGKNLTLAHGAACPRKTGVKKGSPEVLSHARQSFPPEKSGRRAVS
jgi:hypothetical protein